MRGTGSWGVGCCSWACDAVDAGGGLKQVQQQQQQQQHDGSSDITRTLSAGSDVTRTLSGGDITRTLSGGSAEDCRSPPPGQLRNPKTLIFAGRSVPVKNCAFACVAPGSISGVAAADVLRCAMLHRIPVLKI